MYKGRTDEEIDRLLADEYASKRVTIKYELFEKIRLLAHNACFGRVTAAEMKDQGHDILVGLPSDYQIELQSKARKGGKIA